MAGIVPSGQVTGFFYRFTKGPFYKISYEFRIEMADLFSGELGFIPDQLVYRHIKKSGKLEQKHQIRCTLGILPLDMDALVTPRKSASSSCVIFRSCLSRIILSDNFSLSMLLFSLSSLALHLFFIIINKGFPINRAAFHFFAKKSTVEKLL